MRFFYTLVFYFSLPLILLRLLWRSRLAPAYAQRWGERFGVFAPLITEKKVVWIHTVSLGEFIAALPLIRALLQRPELQLVVTTTTPTGSERVKATLGESVFHVYAPYDLPDCLMRFMARVRPELLIIMETELWPNTLAACARREIPVVLINARLSARSARGYGRVAGLTRPMLQRLSCAAIQNAEDAQRFIALGLPPDRAQVTGNIKFDLTLGEDLLARARQLKADWSLSGKRLVWIAASTHPGEDELILTALTRLRESSSVEAQKLLLVLVPRHPERFNAVAELCQAQGFRLVRRTSGELPDAACDLVLGDTLGELLLLYGASDMAFVGGSLVPRGGHNFIEAAAWRLPLLSGTHVFNFVEASQLLHSAGALAWVSSPEELARVVDNLASDGQLREQGGKAALAVADANRGALEKTLLLLDTYL